MLLADQLTAALWRAGVVVDPPALSDALQVEQYAAGRKLGKRNWTASHVQAHPRAGNSGRFQSKVKDDGQGKLPFNEKEHSRVPSGSPEGGQFTSGEGESKPSPPAVRPWQRQTKLTLAFQEEIAKRSKDRYALCNALQTELDRRDSPDGQIVRYRATKLGDFWNAFTRGLSRGTSQAGGFGGPWEETKHPRQGKGKDTGGQFAPKGADGGGGTSASTSAKPTAPTGPVANTGTPVNQQGKTRTVAIDGQRHDVMQAGGRWYGKPSGQKKAEWAPLSKKQEAQAKDEIARDEFAERERAATKARQRHNGHKAFILRALADGGPKKGNAVWKAMGIPKDDFLDAFFALSEEGRIEQDPQTGVISLKDRPAASPKQPKATKPKKSTKSAEPEKPQFIVVKPKLTDEQKRAAREAKEKAEKEQHERRKALMAEARKAKHEDRKGQVDQIAADYEVDPGHLLEAAKFIVEEKKKIVAERENAKRHAMELLNMDAGDIHRLENQGKDYSSIPGFDEAVLTIANQHPGVIGNYDYDQSVVGQFEPSRL